MTKKSREGYSLSNKRIYEKGHRGAKSVEAVVEENKDLIVEGITGQFYVKGHRGAVKYENLPAVFAEAIGIENTSDLPESFSEAVLNRTTVRKHAAEFRNDVLWWNKVRATEKEAREYLKIDPSHRTKKQQQVVSEYEMQRTYIALYRDEYANLDPTKRAKAIREASGYDTVWEGYNNFKENELAVKFKEAVMSVDEAELRKFGLSEDEIRTIANYNEDKRYDYVMERISIGDITYLG